MSGLSFLELLKVLSFENLHFAGFILSFIGVCYY